MTEVILAYIAFNTWAMIVGMKEAIIYSLRGAVAFPWDEHDLYIVERLLVYSFFAFGMFLSLSDIIVLAPICFLSFFFFHDGFYEQSRGWIDQPDMNFKTTSTSSTAKWNPTFERRLLLLLSSVVLLIIYLSLRP